MSTSKTVHASRHRSTITGSEFLDAYEKDPLVLLTTLVGGQDYAQIEVGRRQILLINSLSLLQLVMTDKRFIRGKVTRSLKRLFGHGLGTLDGQEHREHRSVLLPAFTPRIVEMLYKPTIASQTAMFAARFDDNQVVDIFAEVAKFLVDLTASNLFDSDWRDYEVDIFSCLRTGSRFVVGRAKSPGSGFIQEGHSYFHTVMETAIDSVLEQYNASLASPNRALSIIMREGLEHRRWSMAAVRDELRFLLVAGVETTAATVCFALHLLACNRQIQDDVFEELASSSGDQEPVAHFDIHQLPRLTRAIKETLRLYPPVWVFTREAETDIKNNILSIPRGTTVFLSAYVTQRDTRYFAQADKFLPERFNSKPPTWSYFPFGGGAKHCIGEGYGMTVVTLLIANMVRSWQLDHVSDTTLDPEPASTLVPSKPCLIKLKRR